MIEWTERERELADRIAGYAEQLSADHVEWDGRAVFPWDKWKIVQETDLFRAPIGREWGGHQRDLLSTMYALERLGYGCRDGGLSFSVSTQLVSVAVALQEFGPTTLKQRYLPGIADGTVVCAHAITEPEHGSDALNIQTTAVRDGSDYVLNGSKIYITNGPIADVFLLYVRTGEPGSPLSLSVFLVPKDTPGLQVGPPLAKMGLRTSPLCRLEFTDLRVPAANLIGPAGLGFMVLDHVMKREILFSFSITLGEMHHRLDQCVRRAKRRSQFGQPIGKYQAVSHRIADMAVAVETARKWLYDTGTKVAAGKDATVDVAATKLVVSEANVSTALAALQLHGGEGYLAETGVEKDVRNALAGTIYSGTSEIQRNRIAAMLGL